MQKHGLLGIEPLTREQIQVRLANVDNEPDAVWLLKE